MDSFDEPPKRSKQIIFLVTPEEKKRLEDAARAEKKNVSQLIRAALNRYLRRKKKSE